MLRREVVVRASVTGVAALVLMVGCDTASTGTAPVAHDQDKSVGHMNHPAAGPNSPLAKVKPKASDTAK